MRTNNTVPFFYSPDDNPWGTGGATIVNKDAEQDDVVDVIEPEPTPAAPDPEPTPAEPEPAAQPAAQTEPPAAAAPVIPEPVKDWRETVSSDELLSEVTKKADRKALLKAAGIDEETIKAIEFREANGGNWNEYLRVKNTDYKALDAQQLIEMDLREKYPALDNKKFAIVLKNELRKYNLDRDEHDENSEEAVLGAIMLDKDSDSIRAKYIEKQDSLKAPEKQPDTTAQDREVFQREITDTIRNSDAVRNLQSSKLISFGTGEEAFNYEVKTEVSQLVDATITAAHQNGQKPSDAEISKMVKTLAYHINPEAVEKALIDHGKILGNKEVRREVANTQPNSETSTTNFENLSDAELLAKSGKVRNG